MPSIPIAAFLAGALLSLLLPVGLLSVLSVWYWVFSARVPVTAEKREADQDAPAPTPGPSVTQTLPHDPGT